MDQDSAAGTISPPGPQPGPQAHFLRATWCEEVGYGGARGGGKTAGSLLDYLQDVPKYGKAWKGILFRKTFPELEEVISQAKEFYLPTGADYHETKKTFFFKEGSTLKLRALEKKRDAEKYQGHQYTWICFEELGNWPDFQAYDMLKACLRSPHSVPTKRIRSTFNPGGPGHAAIKKRFVDPAPGGYQLIDDEYGRRMYIPAKVTDNIILLRNDPQYIARLKQVGSPELVRAWLDGDFNAIEGAYFPEFSAAHIIRPFSVSTHWQRIRAYDHGYRSPFCVLWAAVSSGKNDDGTESKIPRGALVVYREWYGSTGSNTGLRMDPREIAEGIRARESDEHINDMVADPAIFKTEGGPSIAEEFFNHKVEWRPADNQRLPGWMQIRLRLKHEPEPALYFFSTCKNLIELMPLLQHCPKRPEDADTTGEDHPHDTLRYLCMARPITQDFKEKEPVRQWNEVPLAEFIKADRRKSRRRR